MPGSERLRGQVAIGIGCRACAKTVEAKAAEFNALFTTREVQTQEEMARALDLERDRERLVATMDKE